jgi:hypothetical protein
MAETITIYAGQKRTGVLKKLALEDEARRKRLSLSEMIWEWAKRHGSEKLREDLEAADSAVSK